MFATEFYDGQEEMKMYKAQAAPDLFPEKIHKFSSYSLREQLEDEDNTVVHSRLLVLCHAF